MIRRAGLFVALWTALLTGMAAAQQIVGAAYDGPVTRYGHLVLGKDHNYDTLVLRLSDGRRLRLTHAVQVFEDTAPRLVDMDGDGAPEVIVVESDPARGARVAVYGLVGETAALRAATPHIGQTNRWYAPVGAADLDGDGSMEIAFVDRPHLARILRVWRYGPNGLAEIATLEGLTNHRIGEDWISGGIRDCGQGPEMILATADWSAMVAVRFRAGVLTARAIGDDTARATFDRALGCR